MVQSFSMDHACRRHDVKSQGGALHLGPGDIYFSHLTAAWKESACRTIRFFDPQASPVHLNGHYNSPNQPFFARIT